ncbi:MAG TPA: protein kinase [Bryobacteraceae bacterium]|nr:protein kinase [Bryobacteraceae bacterium]
MTQDAERLFLEAVELPQEQRRIFLSEHCSSDDLRWEVESLLAGDELAASFLESAVVEAAESLQQATDRPASPNIGPWQITRELGRGGMGVVYAAERSDGLYSQHAAIKVIQRRPDQASLVARFERERRILAGLSHPNIARLFDGGTSPEGLPYLVMEYVDGVPISKYVRDRAVGIRQTVELFLAVCSGVEHAHRHFIVHRDIKPANILVDADGLVKLLDFGIATMTDVRAAETQTLALTLEYASPEQVRGEPVTTATDVYSLGGVLYHLLTGETPLRLGQAPLEDCLSAIVDREPRDPRDVRPAVGRDLSHIVLRALRKEPDRRYPSVEALRLDLERYLKGLSVEARGNSPIYLASRFLRRRWLPVAAATLVFASAIGAAVQSRRAQARAEYASHIAEQARQAAEVDRRKAEESGREADRQRKLADERAASFEEQFDRANRNLGASRAIALSVTSMFDGQFRAGNPGEAIPTLDRWLSLQRELYRDNPDNPDVRKLLGILESRRCIVAANDNRNDASPSCEESIRLLEGLSNTPRDDEWLRENLAWTRATLGKLRALFGKSDEGIALCRRSLEDIKAAYRLNPEDIRARFTEASLRLDFAEVLVFANRIDEALRVFGDSYRVLRSLDKKSLDGLNFVVVGVAGVRFSKIAAKRDQAHAEQLMEEGLGWLRLGVESPKAGILEWNEYANALNECPYPRLRNKDAALIYAKRAVAATRNSNPAALDTLAWAYYRAGDRTLALETARLALRVAPSVSLIRMTIAKSLSQFEKNP